jgi:hypothetical protein
MEMGRNEEGEEEGEGEKGMRGGMGMREMGK